MRVPCGPRQKRTEVDAVGGKRCDTASGDHGDKRDDKKRHERDARARDALTDPLDACFRH